MPDTGADVAAGRTFNAKAAANTATDAATADAVTRARPTKSRRLDSAVRRCDAVAVTEPDAELAAAGTVAARKSRKRVARSDSVGHGSAAADAFRRANATADCAANGAAD